MKKGKKEKETLCEEQTPTVEPPYFNNSMHGGVVASRYGSEYRKYRASVLVRQN